MPEVLIHSNSLLCKRYSKVLLRDITFRLDAGEVMLVSGPPGSGKSVLVNILTGIRKPVAGSLIIMDKNVTKTTRFEFEGVKCSWQDPSLYTFMPLEKNLFFFSSLYNIPKRNAKKEIIDLMKAFGLYDKRRQYIATMSPGDQKKADLCRALMGKCRLLILDEPFFLLDSDTSSLLVGMLKEKKRQGVGIVIAASNVKPVEDICDRVMVLNRGRIVMNQKKSKILERREKVIVADLADSSDMARLKGLEFVNDVKQVGGRFHLRLGRDMDLEEIFGAISRQGISLGGIRVSQPSLQAAIEEVLQNA